MAPTALNIANKCKKEMQRIKELCELREEGGEVNWIIHACIDATCSASTIKINVDSNQADEWPMEE